MTKSKYQINPKFECRNPKQILNPKLKIRNKYEARNPDLRTKTGKGCHLESAKGWMRNLEMLVMCSILLLFKISRYEDDRNDSIRVIG